MVLIPFEETADAISNFIEIESAPYSMPKHMLPLLWTRCRPSCRTFLVGPCRSGATVLSNLLSSPAVANRG